MATWVRNGTGTAPTSTDADLIGRYSLDNGTAPGDFDPNAVTSVQIAYTITGSGFAGDTWDDLRAATLDNGTNVAAVINGTDNTGLQNTTSNTSETDNAPDNTLSVANWEAMAVSGGTGIDGSYTTWHQDKGKDGGVQTMSALTVTITYTPAAVTLELVGASEAAAESPGSPFQVHSPTAAHEAAVEALASATQIHSPVAQSTAAVEASGSVTVVVPAVEVTGAATAAVESTASPTQTHSPSAASSAAVETSAAVVQVHQLTASSQSAAIASASPTQVHKATGQSSAVAEAFGFFGSVTGSPVEVSLTAGIDPGVDTNHFLQVRARSAGTTGDFTIQLKQGAAVIQEWTQSLTASFALYTLPVTNAASITDYTALSVWMQAVSSTLDPEVSWLCLQVPVSQNVKQVSGASSGAAQASGTPIQVQVLTAASSAVAADTASSSQVQVVTARVQSAVEAVGQPTEILALSGAASSAAATTAALAQVQSLTASSDAAAVVVGTPIQVHRPSAASTAAVESLGTLTVEGRLLLVGLAESAVEAVGTLTQISGAVQLVGDASAAVSAVGSPSVTITLPASGVESAAQVQGTLTLVLTLPASQVDAAVIVGGSLSLIHQSSGSSSAAAVAVGTLKLITKYRGEVVGVAEALGVLTNIPRILFGKVSPSDAPVNPLTLSDSAVSGLGLGNAPAYAVAASDSAASPVVDDDSLITVGLSDDG